MRSIEFGELTRPEFEAPQEQVSELMENCLRLLDKYGSPQKRRLPRRMLSRFQRGIPASSAISFTEAVSSREGPVEIVISANRPIPQKPEIIRMEPRGHMVELVLVRGENDQITALILENWGMGEKLDQVEHLEEQESDHTRIYTNPRIASSEEVGEYQKALEGILQRRPVN